MSGTTITFSIFAVIVLCVIAIYFTQARERARVERVRRINILRERNSRMQQLLHELPPQYLTNDQRIMILEGSNQVLNELASLKPDDKSQKELAGNQEMLKNLREKNPKFSPVPVTTEAQGKNVRKLLEILYKFIQTQHKNKQLDAVSAKKYMDQIVFSVGQSKADMFVMKAETAQKAGKHRVAIHNYHNAVGAFKDMASHPQAAACIKQYRAQIKALEAIADEHNQKMKEASQNNLDANSEWDEYLNKEDDAWKKKNQYDD